MKNLINKIKKEKCTCKITYLQMSRGSAYNWSYCMCDRCKELKAISDIATEDICSEVDRQKRKIEKELIKSSKKSFVLKYE